MLIEGPVAQLGSYLRKKRFSPLISTHLFLHTSSSETYYNHQCLWRKHFAHNFFNFSASPAPLFFCALMKRIANRRNLDRVPVINAAFQSTMPLILTLFKTCSSTSYIRSYFFFHFRLFIKFSLTLKWGDSLSCNLFFLYSIPFVSRRINFPVYNYL